MTDNTPDSTEVVTTPSADAEPAVVQEESQAPVSDDTADSTENDVVKNRAQQRIEQLVADNKQLREDRQHAMDYAALQRPANVEPVKEDPAPLVAPTLESCDFDEPLFGQKTQEFYGQLIDLKVNEATSKAINESSQQAAQARLDADWTQRVNAYKVNNPDFDKEAYASEGIYKVIKNDPQGPQIAHELGKNPAEAQRIGLLQGTAQALALGEFKSKLSSKPTAKTETSKAPDPMSPVGSSETNTTPNDSESVEDYVARRRAEKKEKRRA